MNEIIKQKKIKIEDMIYEIRGKQVMLDRDLASLYNTETRILVQKVKRNVERFPSTAETSVLKFLSEYDFESS